jgi:hypothetical protein
MDGRRWAGILGALEGVLLLCGVGFASLLGADGAHLHDARDRGSDGRTAGLPMVAAAVGLATFCAWALLIAPLGDQFGT